MADMTYRTKTYIAADWDGDNDAVEQLRKWNDSNYWGLSFTDAHDGTESSDDSLNCSIKAALRKRFDKSKTFVLIVGTDTKSLRSGGCQYCAYYSSNDKSCSKGRSVDYRSYVEWECDKAIKEFNDGNIKKIIVLYNAASIDKSKCLDSIKSIGTHEKMKYTFTKDGKRYWDWDYQAVKSAFDK